MSSVAEATLTRKHWKLGYALYLAHLGVDHCQHPAQRRGWMAALFAEAECNTPGLASSRGW